MSPFTKKHLTHHSTNVGENTMKWMIGRYVTGVDALLCNIITINNFKWTMSRKPVSDRFSLSPVRPLSFGLEVRYRRLYLGTGTCIHRVPRYRYRYFAIGTGTTVQVLFFRFIHEVASLQCTCSNSCSVLIYFYIVIYE